MFCQTVDRMNAVPQKLYTEFLNQIGYQEPGPVAGPGQYAVYAQRVGGAAGAGPSGTQVFTSDESGSNVGL